MSLRIRIFIGLACFLAIPLAGLVAAEVVTYTVTGLGPITNGEKPSLIFEQPDLRMEIAKHSKSVVLDEFYLTSAPGPVRITRLTVKAKIQPPALRNIRLVDEQGTTVDSTYQLVPVKILDTVYSFATFRNGFTVPDGQHRYAVVADLDIVNWKSLLALLQTTDPKLEIIIWYVDSVGGWPHFFSTNVTIN